RQYSQPLSIAHERRMNPSVRAMERGRGARNGGSPMPDWFIDELAHAGDEHLDAAYVATYDRKAGTDPTEDVALMRSLGLGEKSVLVDLGAGTGTFALAAAPYCRRVVAVDVSQTMLAVLRTNAERLGLAQVETVQAGFLTYAHQGD